MVYSIGFSYSCTISFYLVQIVLYNRYTYNDSRKLSTANPSTGNKIRCALRNISPIKLFVKTLRHRPVQMDGT